MQRFGYLADTGQLEIGALYSESAVTEAIKRVQRFGALSETGVLDEDTTKVRAVKGSAVVIVKVHSLMTLVLALALSS